MEFTVVDFAGGSRLNEHAFATLGLSKIPLHSPSHTGHIYQELVIVVPETLGLVPVPDTLQHVAQEAVATGRAVVTDPPHPILARVDRRSSKRAVGFGVVMTGSIRQPTAL